MGRRFRVMGCMVEYIALDGQEWLGTGIVALFAAQKWRRKLYFCGYFGVGNSNCHATLEFYGIVAA